MFSSADVNIYITVTLGRAGGVLQDSAEERPGHGLRCGCHPHSAGVPQEGQRWVQPRYHHSYRRVGSGSLGHLQMVHCVGVCGCVGVCLTIIRSTG